MSLNKKRQLAALDFANRFIQRHFPRRAFVAPDVGNPFRGAHSFSSAYALYLHGVCHPSLLTGVLTADAASEPIPPRIGANAVNRSYRSLGAARPCIQAAMLGKRGSKPSSPGFEGAASGRCETPDRSFVSPHGRDEISSRPEMLPYKYIKSQEKEDQRLEQLNLWR